jgi:hypothetical protein
MVKKYALLFCLPVMTLASCSNFENIITKPADYTIEAKQAVDELRPCLRNWFTPLIGNQPLVDWERGIYIASVVTRLVVEQRDGYVHLYFNDWMLYRGKARRALDECNDNPKSFPDAEFRSAF